MEEKKNKWSYRWQIRQKEALDIVLSSRGHTHLDYSVVQALRVLLKLLSNSEVHLIISECAESFGLKSISILHNNLCLCEVCGNLTRGKVYVW